MRGPDGNYIPIPPRATRDQSRAAWAKSAKVRIDRARVKASLKTGRMSVDELLALAAEDETIRGMKVSDVLLALPGVGKVRAQRLMDELDISPTRRLRGLGARQRAGLIYAFSE